MPCAAIIVASGSSSRMGYDKLAAPLDGIPVLRRSVEALMTVPMIERVIVVCPEDRFNRLLSDSFPKLIERVDGGTRRQDSVLNGLNTLDSSEMIVAVHDGARPLVSSDDVTECIKAARQYGAAALARPVTETIKRADHEGFVRASIDRSSLWFMETPQVFRTSLLRRGYENAEELNLQLTDEVSAVDSIGIATKLVPSTRPNPKLTVPEDIELAEALLARNAG